MTTTEETVEQQEAGDEAAGASTGLDDIDTGDFETLQQSGRAVAGNRERATVDRVVVGESTARITLSFDWTTDTDTLTYDLDSERAIFRLKTLAREHGYEFDQLPYLEDERIEVVYLDGSWHPAATLPDVGRNVLTDAATRPGPLTRGYERLVERVTDVTGTDLVLVVIMIKKLLVALAIVYVVFGGV